MSFHLILASSSQTRIQLLRNAGLEFDVQTPKIDEETVKSSLEHDGAAPRDIADCLAEMKARKISERHPGSTVLGCDQVLDFQGQVFSKPETHEDCISQLTQLGGARHHLLSYYYLSDLHSLP